MDCPSHMDLLEQGNTSGPLQLEFLRLPITFLPVPVWVEELPHPMWEMTTSVKVGIMAQHGLIYCMLVIHSGMVRAVDRLPVAN